jgi:hypothetical protein
MITSNLAPNNQLLPYALRPLTLAFKYEEESEERMGVSRAAILTLAHCQQTETVSDDQANESRWLEGKSNREATWPMRTAHRQRPRSGSFHPILAGGKVDQAHLRELSQDTGSSWRSARVCAKTATLREVK